MKIKVKPKAVKWIAIANHAIILKRRHIKFVCG